MLALSTVYLLFVYIGGCNPDNPGECEFESRAIMEYQDPMECEKEAHQRNKDNLSYMHGEFWKCYLDIEKDSDGGSQ